MRRVVPNDKKNASRRGGRETKGEEENGLINKLFQLGQP